jgi:uncharacterized protein YlaN (UPF0358 family)
MLTLRYELVVTPTSCERYEEVFDTTVEIINYLQEVGCHFLTWNVVDSSTGKEVVL